ncbi:unnamed protein product [Tilletia laevis]|nr:unnamed protein product [Tilletia caries]CAD6918004.1 unnamed protein product [Tilletia controversa]CAD6926851.1 unnamed protein product [Tilletia laevis]CAD7059951.1 unnamed protein product [Tilletia caries]
MDLTPLASKGARDVPSPSASSLILAPLFFLASSFLFSHWAARAVGVRRALQRYDAQPALVVATDDGEGEVKDEEGPKGGSSKVAVGLKTIAGRILLLLGYIGCLFVLDVTDSHHGIWQELYENGTALAAGFFFGAVPGLVEYKPQTPQLSVKEGGETIVWFALHRFEDDPTSILILRLLTLLKPIVVGLVTARTGLVVPFVIYASLLLRFFAAPHGRSLARCVAFCVLVLAGYVGIIGTIIVVAISTGTRPPAVQLEDSALQICDSKTRICALVRGTKPILQWILPALEIGLVIFSLALVLPVLNAARNFDLLAQDKEIGNGLHSQSEPERKDVDGLDFTTIEAKAASDGFKRDENGKIPERLSLPHRAHNDLPTHKAAVRAFQAFFATGILLLLGVGSTSIGDSVEAKLGTVPTFFYPITLQGLLFDPNVKYHRAAVESFILLAWVWGLAAYFLVLSAISFSVYRRDGFPGLRRLWTATDPIWSSGPVKPAPAAKVCAHCHNGRLDTSEKPLIGLQE